MFEDSFQYLQRKTGDQIKHGKLSIRFYDEEGVDAGGVTREWFQILARQMFDPNNALFQPCTADRLSHQSNKNSWVNPEHLSFFKFVVRVIGKVIYDGRLLDAYFARSLYRQLLGKCITCDSRQQTRICATVCAIPALCFHQRADREFVSWFLRNHPAGPCCDL
jgi:E3 ubiquitin-protein ligase HUWE1